MSGKVVKREEEVLAIRERCWELLKRLDREQVEDVTREIADLREVDPKVRDQVVQEFYNLALARSYVKEGGLGYARGLLERSLPKDEAQRIIEQIEHQVSKQPFSFLQKAETENLLTFIQDEHPQTIALILAHLPPHKASEILVGLPAAKQIEVVTRIANMEQTNPEVIKEVEKGLPVIWPLVSKFRQSWELKAKVISQRPGMQKPTAACGAICLPIEQQR